MLLSQEGTLPSSHAPWIFLRFGDAVNFASRMESSGAPNKIQCSQATADKLEKAGKSHWLNQREDKVHAKGIGEIQTYWVRIVGDPSVTSGMDQSLSTTETSMDWGDYRAQNEDDPMWDIRRRLHDRLAEKRSNILRIREEGGNSDDEEEGFSASSAY